ncbi:energy transducer TonB family protein [Salipiger abyssi]|uniref:energy transducer TonB family protein n=1 Tax=Salipiger abyssi TaxID=1250539 RepID=UPI001A900087|nr:energy transducer TonB [Salipiger abyssi]MBN9889409.1 TonB family protein [Salipiger abyssi]
MIAKSRVLKGVALLMACSAHGALALALLPGSEPFEIEGSGGAAEARLGSSFADMAAGTLSATPPEEPTEAEPVEEAALTPEPPAETAQPTPPEAEATPPAERAQTSPSLAEPTPDAIAAEPLPAAPAPDAVAALPAEVPEQTSSEAPAERIEAEEDDTPPNALASSLRPMERPEALRKPEPAPKPAAKPKPKTQKPKTQTARKQPERTPQAAPQGNANRNANAGQERGSETAKATRSGAGGKSNQAGNAAASNYPGQVMRKIARVPRPRLNARGGTVVAFRISGNGGLAGASVLRSSGSSALDAAALRVVHRAAPFPAPPAGARREFSFEISPAN